MIFEAIEQNIRRMRAPRTLFSFRPYRPRIPQRDADSNGKIGFFAFCLSGLVNLMFYIVVKLIPSWVSKYVSWCPTSAQALEAADKELLSNLKRTYKAGFVNIGPCWEKEDNLIWTLKMDPVVKTDKPPMVLLHGFATGVGIWLLNLDSLSVTRPLYAFDMLGFGRSSRPTFSSDAAIAEQQFVTAIEMWRKAVGLQQMILLGHDMGGFLATSYALRHPEYVDRLILVDPWGFPERPITTGNRYDLPSWVRFVTSFLNNFNLLALLRGVGPAGLYALDHLRSDMKKKYEHFVKDSKSITHYIYHCNVQQPSGEVGFKYMTDSAGWPLNPMISRINELDASIPMVFIYGSRSWVNRQPALQIKYSRLNSYVSIQIIDCAGHHVYADQPEQFNAIVHRACQMTDYSDLSS